MYKCLLENDMHVVIGNFRNNRKNVSIQGKENLIEKKFSYAVSRRGVRKPFYKVNMKHFHIALLCFFYPNEPTLILQCKTKLRLYISK